MIEKIFKSVTKISENYNIDTYVVGGFVRDYLLGKKEDKDLDFVVDGSGLNFTRILDKESGLKGSLIEFPDFDTARFVIKDEELEIVLEFAGARSEQYDKESRKPKVSKASIDEDLFRRDFTVNAMAVPVKVFSQTKLPSIAEVKKHLKDPCQGVEGLKNKTLKTPLDPDITFIDDPLRMMRAIRFSAQLDFSIDPVTLNAINKNKDRIKIVSKERITEELLKILACKVPSVGLNLLYHTGLLDFILPEVSTLDDVEEAQGYHHKNNLIHTFKVVDNIAEKTDNVILRLATLLHDIGKPATKKFMPKIGWTFYQHEYVGRKMARNICQRLRLSAEQSKYVQKLIRWHQHPVSLMDQGITDSAVRRLIVNLGEELEDLLLLGRSDITTGNQAKKDRRLKNYDWLEKRIYEVLEKDKLRSFQSPVRGEEIMEICNISAGRKVGEIKKALEEAILDGIIPNEYEATLEYLHKIKNNYLK